MGVAEVVPALRPGLANLWAAVSMARLTSLGSKVVRVVPLMMSVGVWVMFALEAHASNPADRESDQTSGRDRSLGAFEGGDARPALPDPRAGRRVGRPP